MTPVPDNSVPDPAEQKQSTPQVLCLLESLLKIGTLYNF